MRSLPNSSKQPTCSPPNMTMGSPGFQPQNNRRREVSADVGLTGGERSLDSLGPLHWNILDIGEALAAQQFFRHPLRAPAGAGDPRNSDVRRLRRRLGGECIGREVREVAALPATARLVKNSLRFQFWILVFMPNLVHFTHASPTFPLRRHLQLHRDRHRELRAFAFFAGRL